MFSRHVIPQLTAYQHGELSDEEKTRVQAHLQSCAKCRDALEKIRFAARLVSQLSVSTAPDSVLNGSRTGAALSTARRKFPRFVLATAIVVVLAVIIVGRFVIPAGPSWEVRGLPGTERLRPGQVLQTDASSEAQIDIANIGRLTVDPNTRIRLLVTQSNEHRIALDRGRVEASTWAPPRLFIVETPSAKAIDLGCRYSLQVQDDGSSMLHVTLGLVALELEGRETIVPAGAFCMTRKGSGPGTPYFDDASAELQAALAVLDSGAQGLERMRQLEIVLRQSHTRDGLSLWHLLSRMDAQSRGLIYDRLAQLIPPPTSVTRDGIVSLNPDMLNEWKQVVSQLWQ
jgi:hypothetical protein